MADFVLVSGLVSLLFLAVLQVGLALHIRNTLIACASEGARYGGSLFAWVHDVAWVHEVARTRALAAVRKEGHDRWIAVRVR